MAVYKRSNSGTQAVKYSNTRAEKLEHRSGPCRRAVEQQQRCKSGVVRLLSVELFILRVQANKLHFCNLELILNKTGYIAKSWKTNKKSFFNMGTG